MKNQLNNTKLGRIGKSVQNKIHEFYLKEMAQKRKEQLGGKKAEST